MLKRCVEPCKDFIDFLNSLKLTDKPCILVYLPEHDTLVDDSGKEGPAAYSSAKQVIYIAGKQLLDEDLTDLEFFKSRMQRIAHEYIHHVQCVEHREYDEDEANRKSEEIINLFFKGKG